MKKTGLFLKKIFENGGWFFIFLIVIPLMQLQEINWIKIPLIVLIYACVYYAYEKNLYLRKESKCLNPKKLKQVSGIIEECINNINIVDISEIEIIIIGTRRLAFLEAKTGIDIKEKISECEEEILQIYLETKEKLNGTT